MSKERSAAITIGGKEYELVLTTRATKEIAGRYGGLENLGDRLMKSENFEMALDEIIWLITLLANQSVLIHNLQHPEDKKEPLTQDAVELLTSPFELAAIIFTDFKNNPGVERVFKGIRPAVVALIAAPLYKMGKSAGVTRKTIIFPVIAALLVWLLNLSPIYIIIAAILGGLLYGKITHKL